jgi:hypothetical protein
MVPEDNIRYIDYIHKQLQDNNPQTFSESLGSWTSFIVHNSKQLENNVSETGSASMFR